MGIECKPYTQNLNKTRIRSRFTSPCSLFTLTRRAHDYLHLQFILVLKVTKIFEIGEPSLLYPDKDHFYKYIIYIINFYGHQLNCTHGHWFQKSSPVCLTMYRFSFLHANFHFSRLNLWILLSQSVGLFHC